MVQRREKDKDSRYIQEASAPAAVTVYQTCNIMYICNNDVQSREIEKLDCILLKRTTRPHIYESTSTNACVRIYV